ncbi:hypothetical protein N3K66_000971 [Trichothecium roseum]|uniref:Uncharacterized protein n=1 Tax=Trichothecium roseum TaxID=47278 RepID=A0ACC0VDI5_9HYPO|nr:hypothetical protein N3K66_000971 [Trichothecium roseum]
MFLKRVLTATVVGVATSLATATPFDTKAYLEARAGHPLAPITAAAAEAAAAVSLPATYNNTLAEQRADPHIIKHDDGWYYMTATVPAYDQVVIRRAETIDGLRDAEEVVVFRRTTEGQGSGYVWAPELHNIDGNWYVYVALGVTGDDWHIRACVLEGTGSSNPLEAEWEYKGVVETNWDEFSLDMTYFEVDGARYLSWAQFDPTWGDTNTGLFLAPMLNPWTVQLPAVAISYPDLAWERIGHNVNEGAYVIQRNGKLFLTYSASATDSNYCVGLLTADEGADLMDPASWSKAQEPVFSSNEATGQWGPGHSCFTVSEDGASDVFVYHDRGYKDIDGEPLNDPNRRTRVQKLYWRADGTPDFGIPVPDGFTPVRFRVAAGDDGRYLRNLGVGEGVVAAGDAPVEETLFRVTSPGFAGQDSVSLESTNLPGSFLRASADGSVALSADDGSEEFRAEASFTQQNGLTGEDSVSFGAGAGYLKVAESGDLVVGAVEGDETAATFFTE